MRRGFTLIEMVAVLLVIALVTHLAVREVSQLRDDRRTAAADRQLEEIKAAADAFLADVGRLVMVTNGTLSELWRQPAGTDRYTVHVNGGIAVAAGWRGPYLRLPLGKTRLFDPWGNPVEAADDAGLARLVLTNGNYLAEVRHYGPSGLAADSRGRTLSTLKEEGSAVETPSATLVVKWTSSGGGGTGPYRISWHGPGNGTVTNSPSQEVTVDGAAVFHGLTPGERVVAVSNATALVTSRPVTVRPGNNLIVVPVP